MNPQIFFERIESFVKDAGKIAMDFLPDSAPALKDDRSVITNADMAISRLAHEELADLLQTPEHLLIEEEDPMAASYLDQALLDKTPYIWSIDPIDGTRLYANRIPHFSISIGLIKDLRPWMGAVYFPMLNELFYCDGARAFFARNAFSPEERKTEILPREVEITSKSILLSDDENFKEHGWDYKDCQILISGAATVDLCWPAVGRASGGTFMSCLWDMAGSWPIVHAAGMNLRDVATGRVLDTLDADAFSRGPKPWRVKGYYILSTEESFEILRKKLIQRRVFNP